MGRLLGFNLAEIVEVVYNCIWDEMPALGSIIVRV